MKVILQLTLLTLLTPQISYGIDCNEKVDAWAEASKPILNAAHKHPTNENLTNLRSEFVKITELLKEIQHSQEVDMRSYISDAEEIAAFPLHNKPYTDRPATLKSLNQYIYRLWKIADKNAKSTPCQVPEKEAENRHHTRTRTAG